MSEDTQEEMPNRQYRRALERSMSKRYLMPIGICYLCALPSFGKNRCQCKPEKPQYAAMPDWKVELLQEAA